MITDGARLRVLHVAGCYLPAREWGGVPNAVASSVRALSDAGVNVEVWTTTQRSTRALPPIAPGARVIDGVTVRHFRSLDSFGRAFLAPALVAELWRHAGDFDAVHVHMLWTAVGLAAARICRQRGIPYFYTPHGALTPEALRERAFEKRMFLALAERRNILGAALLHFTVEAERAAAPPWVARMRSVVVPNALDVATFLARGNDEDRARSHTVLLLARIHPLKGFDILIPAMRRVVAAEPRARLVIAGPDEGGHLRHVKAAIDAAGLSAQVDLAGLLDPDGRARALDSAAVLVAPSVSENFCLSVAEAMAAGLPVVVSDKVRMAADVSAARAGIVVRRDPEELAAALVRLLASPAERAGMGARGRQLVAQRYHPAAVGSALRAAYEAALGARRRPA
jgi:glycosyltransferase involved in cell wall biosynthesis